MYLNRIQSFVDPFRRRIEPKDRDFVGFFKKLPISIT